MAERVSIVTQLFFHFPLPTAIPPAAINPNRYIFSSSPASVFPFLESAWPIQMPIPVEIFGILL
jgi:hypothetical protein